MDRRLILVAIVVLAGCRGKTTVTDPFLGPTTVPPPATGAGVSTGSTIITPTTTPAISPSGSQPASGWTNPYSPPGGFAPSSSTTTTSKMGALVPVAPPTPVDGQVSVATYNRSLDPPIAKPQEPLKFMPPPSRFDPTPMR